MKRWTESRFPGTEQEADITVDGEVNIVGEDCWQLGGDKQWWDHMQLWKRRGDIFNSIMYLVVYFLYSLLLV